MRAVKGGGALILALGALLGVQASSAQAKLTPGQIRLEEDRKRLYDVELEYEKDIGKFFATDAKESAKVAAKAGKDREKAGIDSKLAEKINGTIEKAGGELSEAKIEHLRAAQRADEAKAAALELAAEEAEQEEAKSRIKREEILGALVGERAALEAQIVQDEEAVTAEGL